MSTAQGPVGTITRGTTNPNRLRRFDRWIAHRMARRLRSEVRPVVVDLGYGESPVTTLELADRLARAAGRQVTVVGLEIDPQRVSAAAPLGRPGVEFRRGGFEVPIGQEDAPLVIRAANVLRQYPQAEVHAAWAQMSRRLAPGGLLVEGTCDELGRLASWVSIPGGDQASPGAPSTRRPSPGSPPTPTSLTLSMDVSRLRLPSDVAPRLPKALIHHNVPGESVHDLLDALDDAWARNAARGVFGARQRWLATVAVLREEGWPLLDGPDRWRLGEITVDWRAVAPTGESS